MLAPTRSGGCRDRHAPLSFAARSPVCPPVERFGRPERPLLLCRDERREPTGKLPGGFEMTKRGMPRRFHGQSLRDDVRAADRQASDGICARSRSENER